MKHIVIDLKMDENHKDRSKKNIVINNNINISNDTKVSNVNTNTNSNTNVNLNGDLYKRLFYAVLLFVGGAIFLFLVNSLFSSSHPDDFKGRNNMLLCVSSSEPIRRVIDEWVISDVFSNHGYLYALYNKDVSGEKVDEVIRGNVRDIIKYAEEKNYSIRSTADDGMSSVILLYKNKFAVKYLMASGENRNHISNEFFLKEAGFSEHKIFHDRKVGYIMSYIRDYCSSAEVVVDKTIDEMLSDFNSNKKRIPTEIACDGLCDYRLTNKSCVNKFNSMSMLIKEISGGLWHDDIYEIFLESEKENKLIHTFDYDGGKVIMRFNNSQKK